MAAMAEGLHPCEDDRSASSISGSDQKVSALEERLSHLEEYSRQTFFALLRT